MRPNILAACVLGAASVTFAQVAAPQLGWIPDGPRVRPVYGIPAAAAVGAPIPVDQDFSQIAASQARNYVLVSAADTGIVSVYTLEHGLAPLDGAGNAPDSVAMRHRARSDRSPWARACNFQLSRRTSCCLQRLVDSAPNSSRYHSRSSRGSACGVPPSGGPSRWAPPRMARDPGCSPS